MHQGGNRGEMKIIHIKTKADRKNNHSSRDSKYHSEILPYAVWSLEQHPINIKHCPCRVPQSLCKYIKGCTNEICYLQRQQASISPVWLVMLLQLEQCFKGTKVDNVQNPKWTCCLDDYYLSWDVGKVQTSTIQWYSICYCEFIMLPYLFCEDCR